MSAIRSAAPRVLPFLLIAAATTAAPLAAQWSPEPATDFRLASAAGTVSAAAAPIEWAGGRELFGDRGGFSVQQTSGRHWKKGFLWGFAVGGIVGGVAAYSFSPIVCDVAEDDSCRAVSVLLGVGIYGAGAGLVGMMIGGLVKREAQTGIPFGDSEIGLSPRFGPRAPGSPWELGVHVDLPGR